MDTISISPAPETSRELDNAAELMVGRNFAVLTGAGISTDSGIPDYRGEGAPTRTPMTFEQFLSSDRHRKRYWAGSHLGYRHFARAHANDGHLSLTTLESAGLINGVITQNVDGLHSQAGTQRVVDIHGSMDRVRCLDCGQLFAREAISARIDAANPWFAAAYGTTDSIEIAPDGDAIVDRIDDFVIPECSVCQGRLKPDVVFFGEFIPTDIYREARELVRSADGLLIAGSSLAVNSGIRLLEEARRRKRPVVIINRGSTKADSRATVKINAGTSETLVGLTHRMI